MLRPWNTFTSRAPLPVCHRPHHPVSTSTHYARITTDRVVSTRGAAETDTVGGVALPFRRWHYFSNDTNSNQA
jgi:hypothetical protein